MAADFDDPSAGLLSLPRRLSEPVRFDTVAGVTRRGITQADGRWPWAALGDVVDLRLSSVDKKTVPGERSVRLCNYSDVYHHRAIRADMDYMVATATDREIRNCRLEPGDVVITKDSETADDIGVPAIVSDDVRDLVCGYHLAILRPQKADLDGRFLHYALAAESAKRQFRTYANGITRFGLRTEDISRVRIPLPPIPEQRKIAAILSAVDDAIDKTLAVVNQTQVVKSGVMQELFSRRLLDGWTVVPLVDACAARGQYGANVAKRDFEPGGIRYVRITDIDEDGTLKDVSVGIDSADAYRYLLRTGDILFARSGTVGKSYLHVDTDTRHAFAGYLVRFRTKPGTLLPGFLKEYVNTTMYWRWVAHRQRVTAQPNINAKEYGQLPVPCPPLDEQRRIVGIAAAFTRAIQTAKAEIRRRRELKQALLSALLTHELRVTPDTVAA